MKERLKLAIKTILGLHQCNLDPNRLYQYPDAWLQLRSYYGQYGDDMKISHVFRDVVHGYFVEVGAMEGIRFSNTYGFERRGWTGICIEAHPRYFELLKKNRHGSTTVWAGVGSEDKEGADFYLNYRGSMSTFDKELEPFFRSHYKPWFGGFQKIKIPMVTLNTLLKKYDAPTRFDLLSIDTEGTERNILDGFDIAHWAPRVVIAEISVRREPVIEYMASHNYILACTNNANAFFCRDARDAETIRETAIVGVPVSPKHPLD